MDASVESNARILALALSQHYHLYYYPEGDKRMEKYYPRADGDQIAGWLEVCVTALAVSDVSQADEVCLRLRTQIFSNVIVLHLFKDWIGPRLSVDLEKPMLTIERAYEGLKTTVKRRGSESHVSYFVVFLLTMAEIICLRRSKTLSSASIREAISKLDQLLNSGELLISYDRQKIEEARGQLEILL